MSEDLALSLIEELLSSQQTLVSEISDLSLQIELSDTIKIVAGNNAHAN